MMDLVNASHFGDLNQVKELIASGISPSSRNRMNQSALFLACENGHTEIAKFLLSHGADFCRGAKPLIAASRNGHLDCVELLLQYGAPLYCTNTKGKTPLCVAIENQHYDIVDKLLDHSGPLQLCDRKIAGLVFNRAGKEHLHLIRKLLSKGMTLETSDLSIRNASQYAFKHGFLDLAQSWVAMETKENILKYYSFAVYYSAKYNWSDLLLKMLATGVDVNSVNEGKTALYAACEEGHGNIVKLLLSHGADPLRRNNHGYTYKGTLLPMEVAAMNGHMSVLRQLIEARKSVGSNPCMTATSPLSQITHSHDANRSLKSDSKLSFQLASDNGHIEVCLYFITNYLIDVNEGLVRGFTVLHKAAYVGCVDHVQQLLNLGADAKRLTHNKESVLHILSTASSELGSNFETDRRTSVCDRAAVCRMLINSGADINVVSSQGDTALYRACVLSLTSVVKELLEAGADVNLTSSARYPLFAACENQNTEVVEMLLLAGADVKSTTTTKHETALHVVCSKIASSATDFGCLVELLVKAGADVNAVTADHESVLYRASRLGLAKAVDVLLKAGSDANMSSHKPPLIAACEYGPQDVVDMLLNAGANANVTPPVPAVYLFSYIFHAPVPSGTLSPLCIAVKRGDIDIVNLLLAHNADASYRDHYGQTALNYAMDNLCSSSLQGKPAKPSNKSIEVVKVLLGSVNVNECRDREGRSILQKACLAGIYDLVSEILDHNADVNCTTSNGKTALHCAVENNCVDIVQLLLKNGANCNPALPGDDAAFYYSLRQSSVYQPVLCLAASKGNVIIVEMLLHAGADINVANSLGCTALHLSFVPDVSKALLDAGANTCFVNSDGETPLSTACRKKLVKVIEILLDFGVDPNYVCAKMPLHCACEQGNVELVRLLLTSGANPDIYQLHSISRSCYPDRSALCIACKYRHLDIIMALLKFGADVNVTEINGDSPLHCAMSSAKFTSYTRSSSQLNVINCLLTYKADVNVTNKDGKTALYMACENRATDIVDRLLTSGADANLTTHNFFPLFVACGSHSGEEIVNLLVEHSANPNVTQDNTTPLLVAANLCSYIIVDTLLKHGANVLATDNVGNTALHCVFLSSYKTISKKTNILKLVQRLLKSSIDVNALNNNGETALYLACMNEDIDINIVGQLLEGGANADLVPINSNSARSCMYDTNYARKSPLSHAAVHDNVFLMAMLVKHGADINLQDSAGKTALHYAVEAAAASYSCSIPNSCDTSALQKLLTLGANVNVISNTGETALYIACEKRAAAIAKLLLTHEANPNMASCDKFPLCSACRNADMDLVDLLLEYKADPNAGVEENPATPSTLTILPLALAAKQHNVPIMSKLLQRGVLVNAQDKCGKTALHYAVERELTYHIGGNSDYPVITLLLCKGADPNIMNSDGVTPLYMACIRGNEHLIERMLLYGARPNTGYADKFPLSAVCDRIALVRLLLKKGADPNVGLVQLMAMSSQDCLPRRVYSYCSPLCKAILAGNYDVVKILLDHGADVNAVDLCGGTALHCAMTKQTSHNSILMPATTVKKKDDKSKPKETVLELVLRHVSDLNVIDSSGETPLYKATDQELFSVVHDLLKRGADPNIGINKYPLCAACSSHDSKLVQLLLDSGADPNPKPTGVRDTGPIPYKPTEACGVDPVGEIKLRSPLCIAVERNSHDMVNLLLDKGACVNVFDISGNTPLHIAISQLSHLHRAGVSRIFLLANCSNGEGSTSLSVDNLTAVKLLNHGADPNMLNRDAVSALHLLLVGIERQHYHIRLRPYIGQLIIKLVESGANVKDCFQNLALMSPDYSSLQLMDYSIPLDSRYMFVLELFQAGAGFMLLARCCAHYPRLMMKSSSVSIALCKAAVMAGYHVQQHDLEEQQPVLEAVEDVDDLYFLRVELHSWLNEDRLQPASLMRQARITIRHQLSVSNGHHSICPAIDQLPLPDSLKLYLKFQGHLSEVDLSVNSMEIPPNDVDEDAVLNWDVLDWQGLENYEDEDSDDDDVYYGGSSDEFYDFDDYSRYSFVYNSDFDSDY